MAKEWIELQTCDIFDYTNEDDICRKEITEECFAKGTISEKNEEETNRDYFIIYQGNKYSIPWKTVNWLDKGGMTCNFVVPPCKRKIDLFVLHHDGCLNSKNCAEVLKKRNLGVHFLCDNDGTLYQLTDLENLTYHAKGENSRSIGIEISNAYYMKYNEWYQRHYGDRPFIINAEIHNKKIGPFFGYYPVQEIAVSYLCAAINKILGIPLEMPRNEKGEIITTILESEKLKQFKGIIAHYMITKDKIDPIGLRFEKILKKAKELNEKDK